jgi:molybdate transport system substrate-binding protein
VKISRRLVPTAVMLAVTGAACAAGSFPMADETLTGPDALIVAAASDLRPAFDELGALFTADTGHEVVFDFGSSGQLAQRIVEGAPVDVFASADDTYVDMVLSHDRGDQASKATYAYGRIVIWFRSDASPRPTTIEALTDNSILNVAMANPDHAPYGRAARQALQSTGIWNEISDRLVYGENIADAHRLAATGNAEAAITALSLAIASGESGEWTLIDEELHQPLEQTLVVVTDDPQRHPPASAFAEFVNQPEARSVMNRYGFWLPGETER